MEAFYQESGRAGRDQLPSRSLLYYGMDDRRRMVGSPVSVVQLLFPFRLSKRLLEFQLIIQNCVRNSF